MAGCFEYSTQCIFDAFDIMIEILEGLSTSEPKFFNTIENQVQWIEREIETKFNTNWSWENLKKNKNEMMQIEIQRRMWIMGVRDSWSWGRESLAISIQLW